MKKFIAAAAIFLSGALLAGAVFFFFSPKELLGLTGNEPFEVMGAAGSLEVNHNHTLLSDVYDVVEAIRDRDYVRLSEWVHPERGIYFIPYSTVTEEGNPHFDAAEVRNFAQSTDTYVWGTVDGEGSPISLTPSAYFDRYVYDIDFRAAPIIGINTIVKSGNSLENVKDVYPDAEFVELHNPGSDEYDGLDWKSLKLVFAESAGSLKLIAIIHSEWTV